MSFGIPDCYRDRSSKFRKKKPSKKQKLKKSHKRIRQFFAYAERNKLLSEKFGGITYDEYLKSDLWKAIRTLVLIRNPQCVRCGHTANQVHHSSYSEEILRGIWTSPLWSVCNQCHDFAEFRPDGTKRMDLKEINKLLQAN